MTQNSTSTPVVQVSGRGTNVEFIIDDVSPFDQVTKGVRDYLVANRGMWSGGAIAVNVGNRLTSRDELNELRKIIETGSGLTVIRFSCSPDTMSPPPKPPDPDTLRPLQHNEVLIPDRKADVASQSSVRPIAPRIIEAPRVAQAPRTYPQHNEVIIPEQTVNGARPPLAMPVTPSAAAGEEPKQAAFPMDEASPSVQPSETDPLHNAVTPVPSAVADATQPLLMDEERAQSQRPSYLQSQRDTALLVKSTCRSGEIIRHQGDVVVLGDVNPGSEVIASGDIVVFGCLRGFAHAGSEGDTKATIVALSLGSPRVQIGPHVGVSSGNGFRSNHTDSGPVIAYAWRRSIHVALFQGRFFKYGKGVLYDG